MKRIQSLIVCFLLTWSWFSAPAQNKLSAYEYWFNNSYDDRQTFSINFQFQDESELWSVVSTDNPTKSAFPTAAFSIVTNVACVNSSVQFVNESLDTPDKVILEGWTRAENVASGGRCGLGIGNPDVGSWGAYWGRVEFYKGNLITFSVEIYGNSLVYFDDIRMYESGNSSLPSIPYQMLKFYREQKWYLFSSQEFLAEQFVKHFHLNSLWSFQMKNWLIPTASNDLDGEEAFSSFTLCVSFSSGIQILEFLEVKVYLNPTSGRAYVDFSV